MFPSQICPLPNFFFLFLFVLCFPPFPSQITGPLGSPCKKSDRTNLVCSKPHLSSPVRRTTNDRLAPKTGQNRESVLFSSDDQSSPGRRDPRTTESTQTDVLLPPPSGTEALTVLDSHVFVQKVRSQGKTEVSTGQ